MPTKTISGNPKVYSNYSKFLGVKQAVLGLAEHRFIDKYLFGELHQQAGLSLVLET